MKQIKKFKLIKNNWNPKQQYLTRFGNIFLDDLKTINKTAILKEKYFFIFE